MTPVRALAAGWLLATVHGLWAEPLVTPRPDKEATNFGPCDLEVAPVAIWQALDGGLGVSLTGIGAPDVGSLFEFNIQGSVGVHCHLRDDLALTFEARYIHLSNAGISDQNYGLNAVIAMFGVTKFF